MTNCPACNKEIREGCTFCQDCGCPVWLVPDDRVVSRKTQLKQAAFALAKGIGEAIAFVLGGILSAL